MDGLLLQLVYLVSIAGYFYGLCFDHYVQLIETSVLSVDLLFHERDEFVMVVYLDQSILALCLQSEQLHFHGLDSSIIVYLGPLQVVKVGLGNEGVRFGLF